MPLIVILWIAGWFALVALNLHGLLPISQNTVLMVTIGLCSGLLGYGAPLLSRQRAPARTDVDVSDRALTRLLWVAWLVSLPLIALDLGKVSALAAQGAGAEELRNLALAGDSTDGEPLTVKLVYYFRYFVSQPLIYLAFSLSVGFLVSTGKRTHFYFSSLLLLADNSVTLGRVGLLMILLALVYSTLSERRSSHAVRSRGASRLLLPALVLLGVLAAVTLFRFQSSGLSASEVLGARSVLDYNTAAFVILDQYMHALGDDYSSFHYGQDMLGYFTQAFVALLNKPLALGITSGINETANTLRTFIMIGYDGAGSPLYRNAFATPFFYFYVDFGWVGIIGYSFAFGAMFSAARIAAIRSGTALSHGMYFHLFYILMFSLYNFPWVGPRGLPVIAVMFFMNALSRQRIDDLSAAK